MTRPLLIAIIAAVVVFDVLLVAVLIHFGWGGLPRKFPACKPAADAVTKRFQSFRVGIMNFGFAVHVAADEEHLHLTPVRPLRLLGARPASIPWDRITTIRRSRVGSWVTVKADDLSITGPAWCLDLAA